MKRKFSLIHGLGILCLSACFAVAQEGDRPKGPPQGQGGPPGGGDAASRIAEFMKRADSDGDGKISKEEFIAMSRKETDDRFGRADGNGDGFIDQTEFASITQRMREGGGGMRRPGEGGPGGAPGGGEGGFRRPPGGEGGRPDGAPRPEGGARPEGGPPPGGPGGEGGFRRPEGGPPGQGGAPGQGGPGGGRMGGMFGDPKENFKRMDADGNGSVSEEEYIGAMNKLREMMQQRGGMRPGGEGGPGGAPGGQGGFRRPGGEGGAPGGGGEGGFRRPPVEGGDAPKPDAPAPKPEGDKPKDAA